MSPQEIARKHPVLFHSTRPEALAGIRKHGLLTTRDLVHLFELSEESRNDVYGKIRRTDMTIEHPVHGRATISDNIPLSEKALESCLDDGLTVGSWLDILSRRVFFWPDVKHLCSHLQATSRRGVNRAVMVVDTLGLVSAHFEQCEISAINSGSTIRRPARRGLQTFTKLAGTEYTTWQKMRGKKDTIKEVVIRASVVDISEHLVEVKSSTDFI
ncbi:DUF7002 family protein [Caballeronia insecticola]|nr:hypothetical protein [Caballeronia insecticola]